jgi:hypothetical protein
MVTKTRSKHRGETALSRRIEGEAKGPQQQPQGLADIIGSVEGRAAPHPQSQTDHRWPEPRGPPAQLTRFLRFADLKAMGIVPNYPMLKRMIEHHGFPKGRWLSTNVHVWDAAEVEGWVAALPTERPVPPKVAKVHTKQRRGRP